MSMHKIVTRKKEKAAAFSQFFRRKVETIVSETSINQDADVKERVLFEPESNIFTMENIKKVMTELKPKTYLSEYCSTEWSIYWNHCKNY